MKKTPAKKTYFSVRLESDRSKYAHLEISVHVPKEYGDDHETLVSFRWQTDSDHQGKDAWYGLHTKMDYSGFNVDAVEMSAKAAGIIKHCLGLREDRDEITPATIIKRLEEKKIRRAVYDCRLSRFVEPDDLLPAEFDKWYDEPASGNGGCLANVMARDEDEARRKLTSECANTVAQYGGADQFAAWITDGKPVRRAYNNPTPDYRDVETLLRGPFARAEAPAVESDEAEMVTA